MLQIKNVILSFFHNVEDLVDDQMNSHICSHGLCVCIFHFSTNLCDAFNLTLKFNLLLSGLFSLTVLAVINSPNSKEKMPSFLINVYLSIVQSRCLNLAFILCRLPETRPYFPSAIKKIASSRWTGYIISIQNRVYITLVSGISINSFMSRFSGTIIFFLLKK